MPPGKPETLSLRQLFAKDIPPERWIIADGLLPIGGLLILAGQPKAGKSYTLNALCYAMVTATPALGAQRVLAGGRIAPVFTVDRPRRVLVFEQELGQLDYRSRWRSIVDNESPTHKALILDNLFSRSMDFSLLLDQPGVDLIAAEIEEVKPDVVCFDPLAKFHASEENSATEMGRVMRSLSIIRARFGVSVVVLHHEAKPSEHRQGGAAGRGSSVIFADCDAWMSQRMVNRNAMIAHASFEVRRAKPLRSLTMQCDERELMLFDHWGKPKRGRPESEEEDA